MARVIAALMRHGSYEQPKNMPSAHLPHPLTLKGEQQARQGASRLAALCKQEGWQIDPVVDCSVLLRAWQTANVAAEELSKSFGRDYEVEQYEALVERGVGAAANLTLDEIRSAVDRDPRFEPLPEDWKRQPDFLLPFLGAETLMSAGARVRDHVQLRTRHLAERSHDTLKLFVGHGGCFRHAAVHLGALEIERVSNLSMHYGGFVVLECSRDGEWTQIGGEWKQRDVAGR